MKKGDYVKLISLSSSWVQSDPMLIGKVGRIIRVYPARNALDINAADVLFLGDTISLQHIRETTIRFFRFDDLKKISEKELDYYRMTQ